MVKRILLPVALVLLLCSCQKDIPTDLITFPDEIDTTVDIISEDITSQDADEETESGSLAGLKICIDPGHGLFDESYNESIGPGAVTTKPAFVSGTTGRYQSEGEFNLKLATALKPMLESEGAEVYMTRTTEKAELSNVGRAEYANELACDIVVRIHADGSADTSASGISVLVPGKNEFLTDQDLIGVSRSVGQHVLDRLVANTGAQNRGLVTRTDLTGFNWSEVPVILVECGFMSNSDDDKKLADENYRTLLAKGITEGLIEYYMTV